MCQGYMSASGLWGSRSLNDQTQAFTTFFNQLHKELCELLRFVMKKGHVVLAKGFERSMQNGHTDYGWGTAEETSDAISWCIILLKLEWLLVSQPPMA
mgnify:CR=1 FL=1